MFEHSRELLQLNFSTRLGSLEEYRVVTVNCVTFKQNMLFAFKNLHQLPETPGIYQFLGDRKEILYIGKAKNLKKRISSYFYSKSFSYGKTYHLLRRIKFVKIIPVLYEFEALLLEARLINLYKPKYNVIWKDDKHYLYIKISREEFPRVLFSRREDGSYSIYFGPFPSARTVREAISFLRTIIPFCTQNPRLKKPCFYTHLQLCHPCPAYIRQQIKETQKKLKKEYCQNIKKIKLLLQGKFDSIKKYLRQQMEECTQRKDYEQAAIYRDKLEKFGYLLKQYQTTGAYIENPLLTNQIRKNEQENLTKILRNFFPQLNLLKRIECYDVSNTFGHLVVGSMVTFIDNQPAKQFYRRFRIKFQNKIDDFAALAEMLIRRFNHPEWGKPDLLVVDGGIPQCRAFRKVLSDLNFKIPFLGIAKEDEALVIPNDSGFERIILPRDAVALQLLQRVRDEAHRFAHNYHTLLRLKSLFSGIKDKRML